MFWHGSKDTCDDVRSSHPLHPSINMKATLEHGVSAKGAHGKIQAFEKVYLGYFAVPRRFVGRKRARRFQIVAGLELKSGDKLPR
jgi:hypothetical protein